METRYFYTSPVNHHNLDAWEELAERLEKDVLESCAGVSVDVGEEPVFGYGVDSQGALDSLSALRFSSRNVHIDLWSTIPSYAAISLAFASGIAEAERRTIARRLQTHALEGDVLLRKVEGPYDEDAIQVYGYSFAGGDDQVEDIEFLLDPFDGPIYIGARSYLVNDSGAIDDGSFESFAEAGDAAVFVAGDPEAEKLLWQRALSGDGDGLIAFYGGDDAETPLFERYADRDDLRILLHDAPSAAMRVSLGRGHVRDALVVVYTPGEPPDLERPLLFAI